MVELRTHQLRWGMSAPEKGWVPSPSYVLRRERILTLTASLPPGNLLEIGCGAGALLHDFARRGFRCSALELSPAAIELARYINRFNSKVVIERHPKDDWEAKFDYLFAFEVLEHIEDDLSALRQWARWLKPGGTLVISVPAHPERWTASDIWAGHYRRYQRQPLLELFQQNGLPVSHCESYGFPLKNVIEFIRARYHSRQLRRTSSVCCDREQIAARTARSGIERRLETSAYRLHTCWLGAVVTEVGFVLQRWTAHTDLGNGYIVVGRRPTEIGRT